MLVFSNFIVLNKIWEGHWTNRTYQSLGLDLRVVDALVLAERRRATPTINKRSYASFTF